MKKANQTKVRGAKLQGLKRKVLCQPVAKHSVMLAISELL